MDIVRIAFLILCSALFVWSVFRWHATPETDRDYGARRDMACLLGLAVAGLSGDLVRSRFPDRSVGFFVCSFALAAIAIAALFIVWRLIRAFRRS